MTILQDVKLASLEIDERFLEEFNVMTWGWNTDEPEPDEAGRFLLHLFSRIVIKRYDKGNGQTGWVLTVVGEERPGVYEDAKKFGWAS